MFVRSVRALAVATALVFAVGLVAAPAASAGKVEKKFGGKILVSDKKFPSSAKSESAYIAKIKKNAKSKFLENKEKKEWKVYFAAFFKKPLKDLEYTITIYDVTQNKLMDSFEQYTDSSGAKSLLSFVTLDRGETRYRPNHKILIEISVRKQKVASGVFTILGEPDKHSGKVDFSEDEQ